MRSPTLLLLVGGLAITSTTAQQINCDSFGLEDGYQGVDWRASTKDCAEATNNLEGAFNYPEWDIPLQSNGCQELKASGGCAISICDASDVRRSIKWPTVWAAARIIHARHKHGGKVAGYVSLDDDDNGFKVFVKVAKTGTPNPSNKRRKRDAPAPGLPGKSLFGRRSRPLDSETAELLPLQAKENEDINADQGLLAARENTGYNVINTSRVEIPNANGLYTNIQVGWGDPEIATWYQMNDAADNLVREHESAVQAGSDTSTLRPAAYLAPWNTWIEFEWSAHNNHNVRDIGNGDLLTLVRWAVQRRAEEGNHGSYIMQIRRGAQSIGHLLIRVFRRPANQNNVCG